MSLLCTVWHWVSPLFAVLFAISLTTYLVTFLGNQVCRRRQNLKKKYDAKWALVTGARFVCSNFEKPLWLWHRHCALTLTRPRGNPPSHTQFAFI